MSVSTTPRQPLNLQGARLFFRRWSLLFAIVACCIAMAQQVAVAVTFQFLAHVIVEALAFFAAVFAFCTIATNSLQRKSIWPAIVSPIAAVVLGVAAFLFSGDRFGKVFWASW